jgi:hypothetical protein
VKKNETEEKAMRRIREQLAQASGSRIAVHHSVLHEERLLQPAVRRVQLHVPATLPFENLSQKHHYWFRRTSHFIKYTISLYLIAIREVTIVLQTTTIEQHGWTFAHEQTNEIMT